jgi:wyosine [tRNA(Phe)-imidazoG37] synthetase (radical SAM superfamily)
MNENQHRFCLNSITLDKLICKKRLRFHKKSVVGLGVMPFAGIMTILSNHQETRDGKLNLTNSSNLSSYSPVEPETAFGYPRDFLDNRFVYAVVSPRAKGLSLGVNMNPDKKCNFDCPYCEVNRQEAAREKRLGVKIMAAELMKALRMVHDGRLGQQPRYSKLPAELMRLHHVTLSGDGEPTLAPNFFEAVEAVMHVRAQGEFPFFKIVLVTNATGLDKPEVQEGLKLLDLADEIWAKLDGGSQAYLNLINRPDVLIEKILGNILLVARRRPVVIQSLFPSINGVDPSAEEIARYVQRLVDLKANGAQIAQVQIYSATRPMPQAGCGHLRLKDLSNIARMVRTVAGLRAEVF